MEVEWMILATTYNQPDYGSVDLIGVSERIPLVGAGPWTIERVMVLKVEESPIEAGSNVKLTIEIRNDRFEVVQSSSVQHPIPDLVTQADSIPYIDFYQQWHFDAPGRYSVHFLVDGDEKASLLVNAFIPKQSGVS